MKKIISILSAIGFLAVTASAQLGTNTTVVVGAVGGVVPTILNGGTNNIAGATTNLYTNSIVLPVATHPNVGVMLSYNCNAQATNGNLILDFAKSFDNGTTYETSPSLHVTNALSTAVQYTANTTNFVALFDLVVTNGTHLSLVALKDTGTGTGTATNILVTFNLNNPTTWSLPAPR